jgi:CRP/FNR family cyclic AMP-dependent transcriptional regulator
MTSRVNTAMSLPGTRYAAKSLLAATKMLLRLDLNRRKTGKVLSGKEEHGMPLIPDSAVFLKRIGALPLVTYQAGENVLTAGSRTGRLLILKKGAVVVVKETIEIAKVVEPGAVFGELSTLLDQPHSADVRALETSQFHVADADALLVQDPLVLLYVAAVLARRLDAATQALIELKSQVQASQPGSEIGETIEKMEGLLYRYFRLFE